MASGSDVRAGGAFVEFFSKGDKAVQATLKDLEARMKNMGKAVVLAGAGMAAGRIGGPIRCRGDAPRGDAHHALVAELESFWPCHAWWIPDDVPDQTAPPRHTPSFRGFLGRRVYARDLESGTGNEG